MTFAQKTGHEISVRRIPILKMAKLEVVFTLTHSKRNFAEIKFSGMSLWETCEENSLFCPPHKRKKGKKEKAKKWYKNGNEKKKWLFDLGVDCCLVHFQWLFYKSSVVLIMIIYLYGQKGGGKNEREKIENKLSIDNLI